MRSVEAQRAYAHGYERGVAATLIAIQHHTYDEALANLNGRIQFIFDYVAPGAQRTVTLPQAEST